MTWPNPSEPLRKIADDVLRLSDYYIQYPQASTPWHEPYCQSAYRYYYLNLNKLRCREVFKRGLEVGFFHGLRHFIDWGCGPGTASLALAELPELRSQIQSQILFDHSSDVLKAFQDLHTALVHPTARTQLNLSQAAQPDVTGLIFSYSLTELKTLPAGWKNFEALLILEPSTRDDGRRLLEIRKELIAEGYSIWAPCTHQQDCPLLTHSKSDWCHDRFHVNAPNWFDELEQYLPMKNRTVTTSYLLARKTKAPAWLSQKARLTGDSLEEKGKTRQLVCRSTEREFLCWMHKNIEAQTLARGELIDLTGLDYEIKSNELRLKSPLKLS